MAESEAKTEAPESLINAQSQKSTESGVAGDGAAKPDTGKVTLPGWVEGFDGKAKEDLSRRLTENPEFLKETKGLSDLYRDWVQKSELAKRPVVPDKSAPKEEWDRYYKAIGRPESPDGYAFEKSTLPQGMVYDQAFEAWFRTQAFQHGMSQEQAASLYKAYSDGKIAEYGSGTKQQAEAAEKAKAARAAQRQEAETKLRAEWGTKFDDNLRSAAQLVKDERFMSEADRAQMVASGLDNSPWFLKLASLAYAAVKGDNALGIGRSADGGGSGPETPELRYEGMNKRYQ